MSRQHRLVVAAAFCLLAALVTANRQDQNGTKLTRTARSKFELPKLFNYELFKRTFNRHFGSLSEELARKRIYLGRAFRVFIAAVGYKSKRLSSYLAINHMSDWTAREMSELSNGASKFAQFGARQVEVLTPVADLGDIERKLADIVERQEYGSDFARFSEQVISMERQTRSNSSELIKLEESSEDSPKIVHSIPSNNPAYERPQVESMSELGVKVERREPVGVDLAGEGYLDLVVRFVSSVFSCVREVKETGEVEMADLVYIDLRQTNCLFQPRNQGKCGSCYAFATLALYEWLYCMATGRLVDFSEQYVVDCGFLVNLDGCVGGHPSKVARFIQKYGLELQANYPYVGAGKHSCPYRSRADSRSMGYLRAEEPGLVHVRTRDFQGALRSSPIIMGISVNAPTFYEYGGGVDLGLGCELSEEAHLMLIVGSGREDGREYWLFRNSFSTGWGEQGHYKLAKGALERCAIEPYGYVSRANFRASGESGKALGQNPHYDASLLPRRPLSAQRP